MLQSLTAVQFIRMLSAGKTAPMFCGCVDSHGQAVGEYVVKLLGRASDGNRGALLELMASRLAAHFGILIPEPAAVIIEPDFVELLVERFPGRAEVFRANEGLNFGSKYLNPVILWPVGKHLPDAMFAAAVDIFSFDALIQNPDRRSENPNLFTSADNMYVYDHEMGFAFLFDILPSDEPWILGHANCNYLKNHALFSGLRAKEIDMTHFRERLEALTDAVLAEIRNEIPCEWMHADLDKIEAHLRKVRGHAAEFALQVKGRLL
jgi:hypothetical protein